MNRRARCVVDSLREYRAVFTHCPDVLRAIVAIEAKHLDCAALFQTLSSTRCASCDRFGNYLYLITCKRVCYHCFTTDLAYLPLTATMAMRLCDIRMKESKHIPRIISLLDRQSLRRDAARMPPPGQEAEAGGLDLKTMEPRRHMAIISAPYFTSSGRSVDWGFYCTSCIDSTAGALDFRDKFTRDGFAGHLARYGVTHGRRR